MLKLELAVKPVHVNTNPCLFLLGRFFLIQLLQQTVFVLLQFCHLPLELQKHWQVHGSLRLVLTKRSNQRRVTNSRTGCTNGILSQTQTVCLNTRGRFLFHNKSVKQSNLIRFLTVRHREMTMFYITCACLELPSPSEEPKLRLSSEELLPSLESALS